jgi:hypothetical protein
MVADSEYTRGIMRECHRQLDAKEMVTVPLNDGREIVIPKDVLDAAYKVSQWLSTQTIGATLYGVTLSTERLYR